MEIKDVVEVNESLAVKDGGLEIEFTKEEIMKLTETAIKKGMTVKELINQIVDDGLENLKKEIEKRIKIKNA